MCINHVRQQISSMECIHHMPTCASTTYVNYVHISICQTNTIYECTIMHHHLHQASISTMHQQAMTPIDVQHDYQLNSPTTCLNM
jgi:hypothetical protein